MPKRLGDADAIAIDQPAAFVGHHIGDFGGIEAVVHLAGKRFELRPKRLLADHLPQLMIAGIRRGQLGHLGQELQEAMLSVRIAVGVLPDLDQPGDLLIDEDRGEQDDEIGRIARGDLAFFLGPDAAMGRQHLRPAHLRRGPEQFRMNLPLVLAVEPDRLHVDLILQLQIALRRADPDGAGRRRDGGQHALQELAVIFCRRQIGLGEPGDFLDEPIDLPPGLFEQIGIIGFGSSAHVDLKDKEARTP